MRREIVLDTETTGLDPSMGHRIIEIAALEVEDFLPTGRQFHAYVDPGRAIDPEAQRVHGISAEFLSGKPTFESPEVVDGLLAFLGEARLVAHNAAFDRAFVEHELRRAGRPAPALDRWIDSLELAQRRFPGMYNSLEALCKRFRVSLAEREKHGALVDAQLLARVYLELRGGRECRLDLRQAPTAEAAYAPGQRHYGARAQPLASRLTEMEEAAHRAFVARELGPDALWLLAN